MGTFADYLEALHRNRALFREANPSVYAAFEVSVQAFDRLARQLRDGRDANGKTHVSLGPLFFIFQRQAMAAYVALASNQAFIAWGLIRTGIGAALVIGKWVDDKANADVWSDRDSNRKAYAALYQGKALQSTGLAGSDRIQAALARINDLFLHPNPSYYYRHLELNELADGATEMKLNFFDEPVDTDVGVLGVLHLVVFVQDALAQMFASLFRCQRLEVGLRSLEAMAGGWAQSTMLKGPGIKTALIELGIWPDLTARSST